MTTQKQTAITRQWHIIQKLVASEHYLSSQNIKDYLANIGIQSDIRTIQRDLQSLSELFPIECNKDDKPYSWRWQQLAHTKNKLTLKQALVFVLIDKELHGVIPDDIFEVIKPLIVRSRYTLAGLDDDSIDAFYIHQSKPTDNRRNCFNKPPTIIYLEQLQNRPQQPSKGLLGKLFGKSKQSIKKEHLHQLAKLLNEIQLHDLSKEIKLLSNKDFNI